MFKIYHKLFHFSFDRERLDKRLPKVLIYFMYDNWNPSPVDGGVLPRPPLMHFINVQAVDEQNNIVLGG